MADLILESKEIPEDLIEYFEPVVNNPSDVFEVNTEPFRGEHYAVFPTALARRMISCASRVGDTVLDPFAGSGTTLLVAERMNRKGIGIDLGYKDIQSKRLSRIKKDISTLFK